LNWQALNYEINGYVVIRPRVWDWDLTTKPHGHQMADV
jgi:hypothetical protein